MDPHRFALYGLFQQHENKERVPVTFTTSNKKPKGKERTDEKKFIEDFLKLQDKVLLGKAKTEQAKLTNSMRYQKRAINQMVKGLRAIASGQDLWFLQNEPNLRNQAGQRPAKSSYQAMVKDSAQPQRCFLTQLVKLAIPKKMNP